MVAATGRHSSYGNRTENSGRHFRQNATQKMRAGLSELQLGRTIDAFSSTVASVLQITQKKTRLLPNGSRDY
jgi:hypothetical protein